MYMRNPTAVQNYLDVFQVAYVGNGRRGKRGKAGKRDKEERHREEREERDMQERETEGGRRVL